MTVTLTLSPDDAMALARQPDGTTVITVPVNVLKQAYCDYVAAEVQQRLSGRQKGESVQ